MAGKGEEEGGGEGRSCWCRRMPGKCLGELELCSAAPRRQSGGRLSLRAALRQDKPPKMRLTGYGDGHTAYRETSLAGKPDALMRLGCTVSRVQFSSRMALTSSTSSR